MRRFNKYIFLASALLITAGCVVIEEDKFEKEELVTLEFSATVEGHQTKTVLTGNHSDGTRSIHWLPEDEIAIYAYENQHRRFVNASDEVSSSTSFVGETVNRETYYAIYPYSSVESWYNNTPIINIPVEQAYTENSFATGAYPMATKGSPKDVLQFKNLCGILVVNLKGEENVKTISLAAIDETGNLAQTAGRFQVDFSEDIPVINACVPPTGNFIKMDCGEGVQLNPSEGTPFHFVLAPGTYSKIAVYVTTTDGKTMVKEGLNPITIRRAEWITAGTLSYVETMTIDLSERGNANCYIVPKAGMYSFETHVVGNGEHGYIENASFYPATPEISPVKAELLWEDKSEIVSGVSLENNRITFLASGLEGNAVIAAKDENDNILWSWHIWVTDQPQDQVYENSKGTFTMLDRNIGATRADRGSEEDYRQSAGLRYQWGRKDPFAENKYNGPNTQLSIAESIQLPTTLAYGNYPWATNWDRNFWSISQKTIYDPCPVGYRVPPMDVWYGFSKDGENTDRTTNMNISGEFDYGFNFVYDGTNTAWYPVNGRALSYWETSSYSGHLWSAENDGGGHSYYLYYYYASALETQLYIKDHTQPTYYGYAVRCMKDEGHVDTSYPTVKLTSISDITSESAHVTANVTDHGISEVTERGILYSTSAEITVDNATKVTSESGDGEYTADLTGLAHSTRYYVRAYAINERGISYSKEMSFYTPYSGSAVDLSVNGTANCYIVPPIYSTYTFDCTVKGNSMISVGTPAEAVVLWETRNDTNPINVGDVIESITLEGDKVKFLLPFEPKPGNALVAVKDANGTILWSWHIWVTDYEPSQTYCTFINGAVMMDRNLGALNMNLGDVKTYGLMYQWGRKDPFMGGGLDDLTNDRRAYTAPADAINYFYYDSSNHPIEHTISSPCTVYNSAQWNDATDLWSYNKTIYDPCPAGWKVSDKTAWDNIQLNIYQNNIYIEIPEPYSLPATYLPFGGYADCNSTLIHVSLGSYTWNSSRGDCLEAFYTNSKLTQCNYPVDNMMNVRCMKDMPSQGGNNEGYTGSDYDW